MPTSHDFHHIVPCRRPHPRHTRRLTIHLIGCLTAVLIFCPTAADLRVVTTTSDLASITRSVGGDLVEVQSITRGHQDAHTVQAKPSFMRRLNRADLLIYTGLELEVGWLPLLIRGARNPAVAVGAMGHLNAATADLPILEKPEGPVDRSMGDVHPEGNPHYLLDPRNGPRVAGLIAGRLARLDPDNASVYADHLESYTAELGSRIALWERRTEHLRGRAIVTYHAQWEYLMHWLGIDIVESVETKPGIPASPRHVASLVSRMRKEDIGILVCANYLDPRAAQQVAVRAGAVHLVLPVSPGGEVDTDDYIDLFEHLITRLVESFGDRAP